MPSDEADVRSVRIDQYDAVTEEARELFDRKNADYGDSFSMHGPVGVVVRMRDKIDRYVSLSKREMRLVDDEKLRDTAIDLVNYSKMLVMLIDEDEDN